MNRVQRKVAWTRSAACHSRAHCDWCPFVMDRTETPLGDAHVWPLDSLHNDKGQIIRSGFLDRWIAPPLNECPFGVTFPAAREKRKAQLLSQVETDRMTYAGAAKVAEAMGLDLE